MRREPSIYLMAVLRWKASAKWNAIEKFASGVRKAQHVLPIQRQPGIFHTGLETDLDVILCNYLVFCFRPAAQQRFVAIVVHHALRYFSKGWNKGLRTCAQLHKVVSVT